jgi:tellurite resistance protein TehA-like permease
MTKHENRHETMTAAWLLPIVGTIVAAASGSVVASVLPNPQHALWTALTSYVLWGTGVPLALGVMVIYFHRLAIHSLPPRQVIVSVFLPLGPLGQGGFSIMKLGQVAMKIFPETKTLHPLAGDMFYIVGFGIALVLWGSGLVWLFFAVASISRSKFPFNMGWWGATFPLGVYAMSTLTLGNQLPSPFFKILGTVSRIRGLILASNHHTNITQVFGVSVILLWLIVAAGTVRNIIRGTLFEAPCLREMEKARQMAIDD